MIGWLVGCYCSHIRSVVATLGQYGAAGRSNNWRHLYSGFTIWLSQSEAAGDFTSFIYLSFLPNLGITVSFMESPELGVAFPFLDIINGPDLMIIRLVSFVTIDY